MRTQGVMTMLSQATITRLDICSECARCDDFWLIYLCPRVDSLFLRPNRRVLIFAFK